MHLKRSKIPKTWPLARKGTKYLVRSKHQLKSSIPLLIMLRDVLGVVETKKEAKSLINLKKVKVNGKVVRDEKFPLSLFDVLSLDDKNFKVIFRNRKFDIVEIKDDNEKIVKVIGKKKLKKGKMQVNLSDGRNFIEDREIKVGDSVVIDLKKNNIKEILPFKEKCKILFISGKHLGEEGIVEKIDEKRKIITLKVKGEKINSKLDSLMVIK
jgi:small subunit ribosomal protein S4e